jgi:hypothetical protein
MKRVRPQEEEKEKEEAPRADWGALCADLVRTLVHLDPSLLPALYLVNKDFHSALDTDDANALYWNNYFHSVPGYSDYAPDPPCVEFIVIDGQTWKALVKLRHTLSPAYYLSLEHPCWPCGNPVPNIPMYALSSQCVCGKKHHWREPITSWEPRLLLLDHVPVKEENMRLGFRHPPWVGCTGRMAGPAYFQWIALTQQIWRVEETNSFTKETRQVLAAARPEDIPEDKAWQVARFVGFV